MLLSHFDQKQNCSVFTFVQYIFSALTADYGFNNGNIHGATSQFLGQKVVQITGKRNYEKTWIGVKPFANQSRLLTTL